MKIRYFTCLMMIPMCFIFCSCSSVDKANEISNFGISAPPEVSPILEIEAGKSYEKPDIPDSSDQGETIEEFKDPWYLERNRVLAEVIKRNNPSLSEKEIETAVERMAIDPDKPMVALSFDDGPIPGITDQILDVLTEYNARATFFVCGWRLEREENRALLNQIVASGSEIGNHTWSHDLHGDLNYIGMRYEIENTNEIVLETTGTLPRCFRPPGGRNSYEAMRVTRENNMIIVLWSQSGNVHENDPAKIAQNVEKQIVDGKELNDGDVILLHDTHLCMVDAIKIIVPTLINEGYQLVTVWELLNCSGEEIIPGDIYQDR